MAHGKGAIKRRVRFECGGIFLRLIRIKNASRTVLTEMAGIDRILDASNRTVKSHKSRCAAVIKSGRCGAGATFPIVSIQQERSKITDAR